ncbi:MAG: gfo/Idh/MocA family oxidoreductase, partial [Planctomyces sp.]
PGHPDGFLEAFANYYADLADWVQPDAEQDVTAASGGIASAEMALEGLQMMEAITESARGGRWVDVGQHAYAV